MSTRFKNLFLITCALLFAACSNEVQQKGGTEPLPDDGNAAATPRREVFLALQNKLILANAPSTKGEVIATEAENAISTLDVYVFGSETEDGEYSFQECFVYRVNPEDKLPKGATELELNTTGKESIALLKLKKGLFVKLYCIANNTTLIDPANGRKVEDSFFQPLTFTTPGQTGTKVQKVGIPTEDVFTSFHTRLLDATAKGDTLVTPLAMAGAYTTPLDLTNFENSARVQAAFRLTRLSSRIDIINDSKASRFTIESISMGHGRRGSQYFPIRVYGDTPKAQPDEIITYPLRSFGGENANKGLTTGAFYCYPSPQEDEAFLILKGHYKINETEMKPVSYQVPFVQQRPDGTAMQLAVVHNHRYTVAITAADEYHLDAIISVEDWADDGSIEYEPDNKPGELTVKIADAFIGDSEYDEKTRTVSMSLKDGSSFEIITSANSALHINKVYAGGPAGQLNDWIKISEPQVITRSALYTYKYTVELTKPYLKGRYPRATLRFRTAADASEKLLFVEALSVPQVTATPQPPKAPNGTSPNPNTLDPDLLTALVFRITNSRAQVKITCPDGVEVESKPDWLDVVMKKQDGSDYTFDVTLNDRDVKDSEGVIVFHNLKKAELKTSMTVNLREAPVIPDYSPIEGTDNDVKPGTPATDTQPAVPDEVTLVVKENNKATVKVKSIDGVSVKIDYPEGSPEWLTYSGASASTTKAAVETAVAAQRPQDVELKSQDIEFIPIKSKLAGAQQATVTLNNNIGGKEYVLIITPKLLPVEITKGKEASVPVQDAIKDDVITLYQLPGTNKAASRMQLSAFALGGSILTIEGDGATISPAQNTANEANYILKPDLPDGTNEATVTLRAKNYTDPTEYKDYTVKVLRADVTGDKAATLTATAGQTVSFKASSHEGFTIDKKTIQWQPDGESGGVQWFNIAITEFDAGKDKTIALTASATAATAKVRPATITLKNNIVNGGDLKVVVTPAYAAPALTVVANTASPTQNTFTAGASASTLKLYKVTGSTMTLKATAIGGSKIKDAVGVSITGGDTYNTENTYKVTLNNGATSGSFKIVNKSDESKVQTVTVQAPVTTISQPTNIFLDLVNNKTTATANITSPEGFTLAESDINWGNGGAKWFKLNTTNVTKNGAITIQAQLSSVDPNKVKTATVKLKNKIAGGGDKTFTVSPVWMAPTAKTSNASALNVMCYKQGTFTVNIPFGGIAASSANTNYATVTTNTGNGMVTYTGKYYSVTGASQTVTITVANAKDSYKKITYTINVQNLKWATGNLVANGANGARIGSSTDYGLMFRWGSLIGYDTSTPGNATAVVTPSGYSGGKPTFTNSPIGNPNNAVNVSAGTGDPCKHYLGGKWRMPTADEYCQMGGNVGVGATFNPWEWTAVNGVNGVKTGPNKALFFPAAGTRDSSSGGFDSQRSYAYVWSSSSISNSSACHLLGHSGNAFVYTGNLRSHGFAVRCVQEP